MSSEKYDHPPYKKQKVESQQDASEEDSEESDENYYKKQADYLENLNPEEIDALIDEQANNEGVAFDKEVLEKCILQLAIKKKKNEELRVKFATKPEKFEQSEVELDDIVRKFDSLSAYPELIGAFIESSALENLIELIYHENTDIVADVINFFFEVITMEVDEKHLDILLQLNLAMAKSKFFDAVATNLQRLNEKVKDEYDTAHKVLGIIEGMVEAKPEFAKAICLETSFLKWVIKRLDPKFSIPARVIDDNILYLSEILPILLADENCQAEFAKLKGIDSLLTYLTKYSKKDPTCEEEKETLLNLADCLCLLLVRKNYQNSFGTTGGIELTISLIQQKNLSSRIALRILSYAVINHQENCSKFVDAQGLKYAFPILVKKGVKSKNQEESQKIEEQITSLLKNILKETSAVQQDRVINKFREDLSKVDRLFELHSNYQNKMKQVQIKISDPAYIKTLQEFEVENLEETIYEKQLEEGLSILENVDFIISYLNQSKDEIVSSKIKKNIKDNKIKEEISKILLQNLEHIDESAERDIAFLTKLVAGL